MTGTSIGRGARGRLLAITALSAFHAGAAWAQTRAFDIPAQPAASGVPAFARQAGVQILAPASDIAGRRVAAVVGFYSVQAALDRLLAPTHLAVVSNDGRTIALTAEHDAAVAPAPAPPASAAPGSDTDVEEVIVTGTRSTTRTVTSSLAPIDVLSAKDLKQSGKTSTRDLISTLVPSANTSNSGAGASFAIKTLALRGLSADQTLVLVNGKRRHDTAILFVNGTTQNGQSPADIDLIPYLSVERIEVLRDGASAQYGSDALAGVINIILKPQDHGGSIDVLYGQTARGDGQTAEVSGNIGLKVLDDGFLNLTGDVRVQNLTDVGANVLNTTQLYSPLPNGQPDPREATANRHTSHPGQPQTQNFSFGYNSELPIKSEIPFTNNVKFYSFGTVSSRDSTAYLTFRNPNSVNNITSVNPDGYTPRLFLHDRDFQFTAGLKGDDLLGFHWDLSSSFSRDDVGYYENSLNASLGPASPTRFYVGTLKSQEWTTNLDLTRTVKLPIFAKPTFVAAGLEYRDDTFTIVAGEPASYINGGYIAPAGTPQAGKVTTAGSQGVTGFPPFSAGEFSRNNFSAYINVEQKLTSKWEASLAGRIENYSDFGDTETVKFSSRYEIMTGFAVRGTISTGFRAPTLQQEHYASSSTIGVALPQGTVLYPVQLLPPDNPAAAALGAKPLQPEKSTNYSIGFVARPIPRLNVTLDLYQIDIDNRILQSATLGPSTVVSNALATLGLNPQQAVFYYGNFADTTTKGIDLVADYRSDLGRFGAVKWTASANWTVNEFNRVAQAPAALAATGIVLLDRVRIGDFTTGQPANKFILGADWAYKIFDTNIRFTDYGKIVQRAALPINDEVLHARVLVDLDFAAHLTNRITFSIGANNLLNAYPDIYKPANRGTPPFAYYNQYSPYGISGAFYYVRTTVSF